MADFTDSPVVQRFLRYVRMNTQGYSGADVSKRQESLARQQAFFAVLQEDFSGVPSEWISQYDTLLMVAIPAGPGYENAPHAVFATHVDTHYDCSGQVTPIIQEYHGGDLRLPNDNVTIAEADLSPFIGQTIITADGTSLLGGDDKAGVAACVEAILGLTKDLVGNHGPVTFLFCTNEEIGELDVSVLPPEVVESWDIFWTVDGEQVGVIDIGCFICQVITVKFKGESSHPGVAAKNLKPAHLAASQFVNFFFSRRLPMFASGSESFYYFNSIQGNAAAAEVVCMPRAYDADEAAEMLQTISGWANGVIEPFGVTVEIENRLVCVNTAKAIETQQSLLDVGLKAHEEYGFGVELIKSRGGTDGGMINVKYPDLPAPNMGAGGFNFHSLREFVVADQLAQVPYIIVNMAYRFGSMTK